MARTPKNYQGNQPTGRHIQDLLPGVLSRLNAKKADKFLLLKEAWPQLIGSKLAAMTSVEEFEQGILKIKVTNSTLLSVLSGHERERLMAKLREAFPSVILKNLHFFIG